MVNLTPYLAPRQLGAGIKGGCEAAVHATRRFLCSLEPGSVIAKLDFSNAFNCLHRDSILSAVFQQSPEIYNYCRLAYSQSSTLWFGEHMIMSEEGAQQGDPLGPLLFCVTVQPLLSSLQSPLTVGFMDDLTLGGPQSVVEQDVASVMEVGANLGLHLNISKCEVVHSADTNITSDTLKSFLPVKPAEASLLGAPLLAGQELDSALDARCLDLSRAIDRLSVIDSHDALILLRSCFCAPKIQHILRCTPCHEHPSLDTFDDLLRSGLCKIINADLSDTQWLQAGLPVKDGGLGIRSVARLAISAYLASADSTLQLQEEILSSTTAPQDLNAEQLSSIWSTSFAKPPPAPPASFKQSAWDSPRIQADKAELWSSFGDKLNVARLTAVSAHP